MPRCVVLAILLGSATAAAQSPQAQARALHAQGEALIRQHAYLEAADRFIAAYNLAPKPGYLLEIARTYRTADACAKSAHYYRAYMSVTHLSTDGALGRELADVDACAARQPTAPVAIEPPQPAPAPAPAPVAPPAPQPASASHPMPLVLTAAGLVLAGGGAVFGIAASNLQTERDDLCLAPCTWSAALTARANDLDSRGSRDSAIAVVGISAGAVAIAAGLALYWADHRSERKVVVAPAPGGASMLIRF